MLHVCLSVTLLRVISPRVFSQKISWNLQETFTLWEERTWYLFYAFCQISRPHRSNLWFSCILRRTPGWNGLKFGILTTFKTVDFPHFGTTWFCDTGQIWPFCSFWEQLEGRPEIWHADVSWLPSKLVRFCSLPDFPHIGTDLTYWDRPDLGFLCILMRMHRVLKFGMPMYPDHLHN